jgi:hypothetical protein
MNAGPADADWAGGRRVLAIGVILAVAAVHILRLGTYLHGSLFRLYYGYASDILVPIAMYFVLVLTMGLYSPLASALNGTAPIEERRHVPFLDTWRAKAAVVFAAASFTEILQACGLPILGQTFDPLDFVMFAVGGLLAAGLDQGILALKTRKPRHGLRSWK